LIDSELKDKHTRIEILEKRKKRVDYETSGCDVTDRRGGEERREVKI
jgi:hypothetical protein